MGYTALMKHLVDLDEAALSAARTALGTSSIKETVNRALQQISHSPSEDEISAALSTLATVPSDVREQAWR